MITADYLRSRLHYDPITGIFTWLAKEVRNRHDLAWNTRRSGTRAGTPDSHGYLQVRIDGVAYLAHRLAWLYVHDEWPSIGLDHEDTDPLNIRIGNLRLATKSQNAMNVRTRRNNKSGVRGVCWDKKSNKWLVQLRKDGVRKYRGEFANLEDARAAYAAAASEHFGEFARAA